MHPALATVGRRHAAWQRDVRDLPVAPRIGAAALRERVQCLDLSRPHPLPALVEELADLLEHGSLHTDHPRYFGLFNAGATAAGVAADALAAVYNPQVGAWWHCPAASEIERHTLDHLRRRIGLPADGGCATFTTGGSEANLSGLLAAFARAFPAALEHGVGRLERPPCFYLSDQAHDSFVKIARATGLGVRAVRRVASDRHHRLDPAALRAAIERDRAAGDAPFLVVATVGTTGTGAIDPVGELAALCRDHGLWLHADAAWGGLALLSDAHRHLVAGLELADSITWDAHKTLPVPMGAGMFFCRWRRFADAMFAVDTGYVPDEEPGTEDPYRHTVQWSRRFIGLKVFTTLAELGATGVAAMIDHQFAMADLLRRKLVDAGWRLTSDSPLPVVCFDRADLPPGGADAVVRAVAADGAAWISALRRPGGDSWLRACITHHDTGARDIDALIAALERARVEVGCRG